MKQPIFLICIVLLIIGCSNEPSYKEMHDDAIVIDGHNDFLMLLTDKGILDYTKNSIAFDKDLANRTHTDISRQKDGGLDVQFFSVWSFGTQTHPYAFANRQIDSLDAFVSRNPTKIIKAQSTREILDAVDQQKLVAVLGVEGGHMIENDLDKLEMLYNRGVRYLTLTWNNSTDWATSANDETSNEELTRKGLTDFGKQVIKKMNDLGMMVDISHVGEKTFWDVIETTNKPVIASHSSVYEICNHQRNLKDDQIKAIAKNGGVIQVNFNPPFIDESFNKKNVAFLANHQSENDSLLNIYGDEWIAEYHLYHKYPEEAKDIRPPLSILIDHIDYIVKLVGADYVGLGSDFDGITITPLELDDVSDFPAITAALLDRGYSRSDIEKILGGNLLRVMQANESH